MTEKKPALFAIAPDAKLSFCKRCGHAVYWIVLHTGRALPVNRDGTNHLTDCPAAEHSESYEPATDVQLDLFGR